MSAIKRFTAPFLLYAKLSIAQLFETVFLNFRAITPLFWVSQIWLQSRKDVKFLLSELPRIFKFEIIKYWIVTEI